MRRDAAEIINSDPATVAKCHGGVLLNGLWDVEKVEQWWFSRILKIFVDYFEIDYNDWDWGDSLQCLGCYYDSYWDQKREREREKNIAIYTGVQWVITANLAIEPCSIECLLGYPTMLVPFS